VTPFDIINSITATKKPLINSENDKEYVPYIVNMGLSYFIDTVAHADAMNRMHWLPNVMQHDYLMGSIKSKKRWSKWVKKTNSEAIDQIAEYYKCSRARAIEYDRILTPEQKQVIARSFTENTI
jgi:hypothetical protein